MAVHMVQEFLIVERLVLGVDTGRDGRVQRMSEWLNGGAHGGQSQEE